MNNDAVVICRTAPASSERMLPEIVNGVDVVSGYRPHLVCASLLHLCGPPWCLNRDLARAVRYTRNPDRRRAELVRHRARHRWREEARSPKGLAVVEADPLSRRAILRLD